MFAAATQNQKSRTLFLHMPRTPFSADLATLLQEASHHCLWSHDDIALIDNNVDLILFLASEFPSESFSEFTNYAHNEGPGLIVIIDAPFNYPDYLEHIALLLPCEPVIIEYQISRYLREKQEEQALHHNQHLLLQQAHELQRENKVLQKQLADLDDKLKTLAHKFENQQQDLLAFELLKDAIVRNVSHELKTPLLQVKSAVSLIKEDPAEASKFVSYAENAVARLETHVTNITMLGHSLDITPGPMMLRDAIDYTRRNLSRIWQRKSELDRILIEIPDNLPPVLADRQALSTVLQLLIDNAIKFSSECIEVSAEQIGNQVLISVKDTGIGIEENELQTIFETFYQVDRSSTRRYGGTGVGLAIVKLILERHLSKINVSSKPGEGSIFSFMLPVADLG